MHSELAYIGVVTSLAGVFNFESLCLSNEVVHSKLANMDGVTLFAGVFNFESPCLSNDTRAFIVFNF